MKQPSYIRVVIAGFLLTIFSYAKAQQYIINPATDGGFEGLHGWTILNTSNINKWVVGTATKSAGSAAAFISDNNSTNTVTNPQAGNSKVYMYKDVVVPYTANSISLSFKYKNPSSATPPPRCLFALASSFPALPTDGRSQLVGAEFLTYLNNETDWRTYTNTSPLTTDRPLTFQSQPLIPGATYRIVFEWSAANQTNLVQQPPICTLPTSGSINGNFTITPNTTETYTAVTSGGSNFTYTWNVTGGAVISSGQGTSSVNIFFPTGYTSGRIQLTMSCPAPTFTSNGTNSGPLAIDEVALSYEGIPQITAISPMNAAVGSTVTISGQNFGASSANNIVYLGGIKCSIVSASSTSISVQVPKHVNMGVFTVINTTSNLNATYSYPFVVTNSSLTGLKYYRRDASSVSSSFEAAVTYTMSSIPSGNHPKFVLADIDGDNKLDIATYSAAGLPQVYRNTATSGVIDASSLALTSITGVAPASPTPTISNLFAFDLNNDGKIDLGASNGTTTNGGYVNVNTSTSGTPSFAAYSSIMSANNEYKVSAGFFPLDINVDGRTDIIGVNAGTGQTYYSRNTSSGTSFAVNTGNTANSGSANQTLTVGGTYYGADYGDLNNDGKIDVVLGKGSGLINILQNTTSQGYPFVQAFKFQEAQQLTAGSTNINSLRLADFDGDGKLDIVAGNASTNANIYVFRNTSSPSSGISFASVQNFATSFASSSYAYAVAVGDMNGDGKPDIIVSNNASGFGYYENNSTVGNISFEAFEAIHATGAYAYVEIADIDGDNKPDIIGSGAANTLTVMRNRQGEAGTVSADQTVCSGTTPAALSAVTAPSLPSGTPQYLWQTSTNLTAWTTAAGTSTNADYTPSSTVAATTYFRRRVNSSDAVSTYYYSNIIRVTVTAAPGTPSGTGATGYGPSAVTLTATPSGTNTVQWFTASSGGTAIASGNTYTTGTLAANTNYYAGSLTSNGCPSTSRATVLATIVTVVPTAPVATAAARCDEGPVTLSATSTNSQEIKWYAAASGGSPLYTGASFVTPTLSATTTYYVEGSNTIGASATRTACIATINRTPAIATVAGGAACKSTAVILSATNDVAGATYKWYVDSTTTTTSGTAQTLSVTPTTGDIIRYVSSINGTCEGPRVKVVATMLAQPAALTATSQDLCGNKPATITLTPPAKSSIAWYTASSGGTLLGNGLSYTTAALATTTTYYAALSDSNGCIAATRSAHTVTYTGPTVGVISNVNAFPLSTNNTFTASGLTNYTSYIWQRSTDGINFTDVTANLDPGTTYSGFSGTSGATASLVISTTQLSMHGYKYRLRVVQADGCEIISNTASYYVAERFGSCTSTAKLTPTAHSSYSPIQQLWFQCDNYGSCSSTGYNYVFGTLHDNSNSTGLIVGADASGNAFITLDFGSAQLIDQVYLQGFQSVGWDPTSSMYICGSQYGFDGGQILVSNDQVNWTTVVSNITNTDFQCSSNPDWSTGSNRFTFPAVSARYVRAFRSGWQTSGLTEFHVFPVNATGAPYIKVLPPTRMSIATGATLTLPVEATPTTGTLSYAWRKSSDGASYTALTDAGTVSGSATNTINVTSFAAGNAGYYKLTATQGSCEVSATVKVELVAPYYSSNAGSGILQTLSSWNTGATGTGGSAPTDFGDNKIFILANSGTSTYTFTANWTVNGILRLNNNKLTVGNFNATIDTVLEGSTNGYVQFTGTGALISNVSNVAKTFPVGAGSHTPISITNNTGTTDNFAVKIASSVLQNGSSGSAMSNVVNRTWTITKVNNNSASANYGVDLKFEWSNTDVSGVVGDPGVYAYISGTGWVLQTGTSVSRTATSVTLLGFKGTLNSTLFMVGNTTPYITSISPASAGTGGTVTITGAYFKDASAVTFGAVNATSYSSNSGGLHFDGSNDYVSIADAAALDFTTNYSIECWVKFSAFSSGASILSKQYAAGANGYYLSLTSTSPYTGINFDGLSSANGLFEANRWYHIAVTKASAVRKLYVNGVEVAISGTPIGANNASTNTTALTLGYNPNTSGYLNAVLDEVRLWNTALTKEQVLTNRHAEIATNSSGLAAYYRFNSLTSTSLTDGVATPKNGTLTNFGLTGNTSNWVEGVYSPTQITAVVGAGASGNVAVTAPGGTATYSSFQFINTPVIQYFTPTKTNRGTAVGVFGQNFTGATVLKFGGTNASSFTVVSDTEIQAVVAAGTSGDVIVTTPGGSDTLAGFVYGVPYSSIELLAAWNKRNTSSASFPLAADVTHVNMVTAAQHSYSGLATVNHVNNAWSNANINNTLDIATAPYLSYTVQTSRSVKFDRVVIPGLELLLSGNLQLRWSVDNFASSLGEFTGGVSPAVRLTSVNLAGLSTQPAGNIEFRVYFYNADETEINYFTGGTGNTTLDGTVPSIYDASYALAIYGSIKPEPTISPLNNYYKNLGEAPFMLGAPQSNSNGAYTFSIANSSVASISGSRVSLLSNGTSAYSLVQLESADYDSAMLSANLYVTGSANLRLSNMHKNLGSGSFVLRPTSLSAGAISYSSGTLGTATITDSTVSLVANGFSVITASQAIASSYNANATSAILTVGSSSLANPTMVWVPIINKQVGNANFSIASSPYTHTSNSAGTATYYAANTSVATLSSSTATIKSAGNSILTIVRAATGSYNAASVASVLVVSDPLLTNPTLTNFPDITKTLGNADFALSSPNSNSEGSITFISSNPAVAVVTGNTVTIIGEGRCHIIAIQEAWGSFNTAAIACTLDVLPSFTYATPVTLVRNAVITSFGPVRNGGSQATYTISPSLPTGLAFNATTGYVTGTPSVSAAAKLYTVTGTTTGGFSTASFVLSVTNVAPSALSYSGPQTYTVGTTVTNLMPTVTGDVARFSISPALPVGLTIDSITGIISGTPAVALATTSFTITAANDAGSSTTATLSITVTDLAINSLAYATPNVLSKGIAISPLVPSTLGGAATSFSVSPALPAGLSIDAATGDITGTPTLAISSLNTYTITASNSANTVTADVQLMVNDAAPENLSYSTPNVYYLGEAIADLTPTYAGGNPTSYSVDPALPAGLSLNTTTGVISGTPTALSSAANYSILATNFLGYSEKIISIAVVQPIPLVTTNAASLVAGTSATVAGEVTDDKGNTVTSRGVVYSSTATVPEVNGTGVTKVDIGAGEGVFSKKLTGLQLNTTYYVRAFATSSSGTGYGSVVTFTTLASCNGASEGTLAQHGDQASINMVTASDYIAVTANCRMLGQLTSWGGSPVSGVVNAKVWVRNTVPTFNGMPFVPRSYEITPETNTTTATATVTLYYTQEDFDLYNTSYNGADLPYDATDVEGLRFNARIYKFSGTSNDGTGLPGSYGTTSESITPSVSWNTDMERWEVTFNVTGFSGFFLGNNSQLLPIVLKQFTGHVTNSGNALHWSTASEVNAKDIQVERSVDGNTFSTIAVVAAKGTAATYQYVDAKASGIQYYRLKLVDKDGKSTYSQIIKLIAKPAQQLSLQVYPNPAAQFIQLNSSVSNAVVKVYDALGYVVLQSNWVNGQRINISTLAAGTYVVELISTSGTVKERFVKH